MLKKLLHTIVLSCLRASYLIEKKQGISLSIIEKLQLRWHLKICDGCKSYNTQSHLLSAALKKDAEELTNPSFKLSNEAKNRIEVALKRK